MFQFSWPISLGWVGKNNKKKTPNRIRFTWAKTAIPQWIRWNGFLSFLLYLLLTSFINTFFQRQVTSGIRLKPKRTPLLSGTIFGLRVFHALRILLEYLKKPLKLKLSIGCKKYYIVVVIDKQVFLTRGRRVVAENDPSWHWASFFLPYLADMTRSDWKWCLDDSVRGHLCLWKDVEKLFYCNQDCWQINELVCGDRKLEAARNDCDNVLLDVGKRL